MARSIISKGPSTEKAIQIGLNLLQTKIENVNIDVIQIEGKGLFWLRKRAAIVKLTVLEEICDVTEPKPLNLVLEKSKDNPAENMDQQENQHGQAWIKDGRVLVNESHTQLPVIVPPDDFALYKNGIRINGPTILTHHDDISIDMNDKTIPPTWSISVDSSNMEAYLSIQPGYVLGLRMKDTAPSSLLKVEIEERKKETLYINIQDVIMRLNEMGISYGLEYEEIRRATLAEEEGSFLIAKGKAPTKGKDGFIKYLIDMKYKTNEPKERPDGTIDFRERYYVPSVSPGQVIAEYISSVTGENGKNIYGVDIPPSPVHELLLRAKSGVMLMVPEHKFIAKEHGRPHIEQRSKLVFASILPKLTVREDVDIEKGNVHFLGDVELLKNVKEKMIVEAEGDLILHGNADYAELVAGHSILIKRNAIHCNISVGNGNMLISDLQQHLKEMDSQFNALVKAVKQLYETNGFQTSDLASLGIGALTRLLVEKKYYHLNPIIKNFVNQVDEHESILEKEWLSLATRLRNCFLILSKEEVTSLGDLVLLAHEVNQFASLNSVPLVSDSSITIAYALNSSIYCSGDIKIVKEGCYNCKINAGGKITINGYVRGGHLFAGQGAVLNETGSEGSTKTFIQVPYNQTIQIKQAHEGTCIQVGDSVHQFAECTHDILAHIDEQGELILDRIK